MKISSAEFIKSAVKRDDYPKIEFPQFAFVGRSNVGKSSLINVLCNQKTLAKTSSIPGKTRLINFFLINKEFYFVDLPGYGYAKVPEKIRLNWKDMITEYFQTENQIAAAFLILDSRREPSELDLMMAEWFRFYKIKSIFIINKIDKLNRSELLMQKEKIVDKLPDVNNNSVVLFSAKTGSGKAEILKLLSNTFEG
jgi:GTP-binding protein